MVPAGPRHYKDFLAEYTPMLLLVLPPLSPLVPPGEDAEDTDGDDDADQEGETQPHCEEYPGLGLDHHQTMRSVPSLYLLISI